MPKMKTVRGAAKRLRRSASGKIIRNRSGAGHLMTSKSTSRRRRLRTKTVVSRADAKAAATLIPYSRKKR